MLHYLQLIIEFVDHGDNYVYEKTDLPDKCILKVSGEVLMNETAYRIGHIFNFHVEVLSISEIGGHEFGHEFRHGFGHGLG